MNQNHKLIYVCIPVRELSQDKYVKARMIREYIQKDGAVVLFSFDDPHGERISACDELWVYSKSARQPDSKLIDFATSRALILASLNDIPVKYFYQSFTPQAIQNSGIQAFEENKGGIADEIAPENPNFLDSH